MTYKTRQEVLRAAAAWMDVCAAAGVEARCMIDGEVYHVNDCDFTSPSHTYELPLGLINGEEVWEGDTVYDMYGKAFIATENCCFDPRLVTWSLTPPKPKTYAVELSEEDRRDILSVGKDSLPVDAAIRILRNLRKALEQPK